MIAATVAGVDDVIPIAKRSAAGSLYSDLVLAGPKLTVALDLTTKCTSKQSCYAYALNEYGNRVSTTEAAYYLDYAWVWLQAGGRKREQVCCYHYYYHIYCKNAMNFSI